MCARFAIFVGFLKLVVHSSYCSTIVVLFERSKEQQMTLLTHHGVQQMDPVTLIPLRFPEPAVKMSLRTTIKMLHQPVMPLLFLEPSNK